MWGARGISPLFLIVVAAWYARASLVDSCSDALSAESGQCWELGEGRPLGILVRQVPSGPPAPFLPGTCHGAHSQLP